MPDESVVLTGFNRGNFCRNFMLPLGHRN